MRVPLFPRFQTVSSPAGGSRPLALLLLAPLFVQVAACSSGCSPGAETGDTVDSAPPGDTHETGEGETGPTGDTDDSGSDGPWYGLQEEVPGEVIYGHLGDGRQYNVLRFNGAASTQATVVIYPHEDQPSRYAEGIPVIVTLFGSITGQPDCSEQGQPQPIFVAGTDAVVLQLLYSGQCCGDVCADGEDDMGAEDTQQALRDTFGFAAGLAHTTQGLSLSEVVGRDVLDDEVALLTSSASGHIALSSMAGDPSAYAQLGAVAMFEVPIIPMQTSRGLGSVADDPDDEVDGDGNGVPWDDMRFVWYEPGQCDTGVCDIDLERLAWDETRAMCDYGTGIFGPSLDAKGIFYIDANENGALDLHPYTKLPDVDDSGALSEDEDFVFQATTDQRTGEDRYWHDPLIMETAEERGLLDPEDWPAHIPTVAEATEFWEAREGFDSITPIVEALPDVPWLIIANWREHGVAQATRPHIVLAHQLVQAAGGSVMLQPSHDSMTQILGDDVPEYDRPGWDDPITEENVQDYLIPEGYGEREVRTAAAEEVFTWIWEDAGP